MSLLQELGIGRHVCPKCDGGTSREKSFGVVCADEGFGMLGCCYRATCGFRLRDAVPAAPTTTFTPNPLRRPYQRPVPGAPGLFGERVLIDDPTTRVWILTDLNGRQTGAVTRDENKKVRTYKEVERGVYYWNGRTHHGMAVPALWIFEDPRSAAVCEQPAVALLGTSLPNSLIEDAKAHGFARVRVALDPGAEEHAAKAHQRLRDAGFDATFVPMLQDFKDMDAASRLELLRAYS